MEKHMNGISPEQPSSYQTPLRNYNNIAKRAAMAEHPII